MTRGKIIRAIAGFYYVDVKDLGLLECRAKGAFRNDGIKPLVGDDVEVEILDGAVMLGNITKILPRKNFLERPAAANVDRAVVIFSASFPKPNLNLLDRFLLMMRTRNIESGICFNKTDASDADELEGLVRTYSGSGCRVYKTSAVTGEGLDELLEDLCGKTTVFAGPSGVGKSSIVNRIFPDANMETGEISEKIKRGRHTTRHSELFSPKEGVYIMDTPGFTSLRLPDIEKADIKRHYPEFDEYGEMCRFCGCAHIDEPDCAVRGAVDAGKISKSRYDGYRQFYDEIGRMKRY